MNIREILASNLRKIREDFNYTQSYVAEACGFEVPSYSRWENGKAWPNPETIEKLSILYSCSPSRFYEDSKTVDDLLQPDIDNIASEASFEVLVSVLNDRLNRIPQGLIDELYYMNPDKSFWSDLDDLMRAYEFKKRNELVAQHHKENPNHRQEVKEARLEQLRQLKESKPMSEGED